MEVPEKVKHKNKNPYDPVIPPLGYLLKGTQLLNHMVRTFLVL